MCLYTKNHIPEIATEDIKVAKMFYIKNGELCAIVQSYVYELNKPIEALYPEKRVITSNTGEYKIDAQGIHSYNKDAIEKELESWVSHIILECIIPKGSLYWKGMLEDIASTSLIVTPKLLYIGKNSNYSAEAILTGYKEYLKSKDIDYVKYISKEETENV